MKKRTKADHFTAEVTARRWYDGAHAEHFPGMTPSRDAEYMGLALAQARLAAATGEVPVGAVLVRPGRHGAADEVLAQAHNQPIARHDPTAHAEMLALRQAAAHLGNYRLDGCELYVTLEPCAMCAQALLHARLARVVYGAREPKTGAHGSVIDVLGHPSLNHQTQVESGLMANECAAVMRAFFAEQRAKARERAVPLRDDALRTPDEAFEALWARWPDLRDHQRWTNEGDALAGLRLHWLDLPPLNASPSSPPVAVALHGPRGWWPEWLPWARAQQAQGTRVLLPDLIGFGQSDKPKKARWHTAAHHADVLVEWLRNLDVAAFNVVAPPEQTALIQVLQQRWPLQPIAADIRRPAPLADQPADWVAWPYPDAGHQEAHKAWPWPAV